jgi:copper chaperone
VERMTLAIEGMSCGHCVKAVTRALERVQGVDVQEVRIGSARVAYDPARTSADAIIDAVNDEGYTASRAEPEGSGAGR